MGQKFIPGGPPRYAHQKRGLRKILDTEGVLTAAAMRCLNGEIYARLQPAQVLEAPLELQRHRHPRGLFRPRSWGHRTRRSGP